MEKLDTKERIKLQAYKEKIGNIVVGWSVGVFSFLLIMSFIPMGFLPSKRPRRISNPDLNFFESLGVMPTILMILSISGALAVYLYISFKYGKLIKDVDELKKIVLKVRVVNVIYKQGAGPQEIDLYFSPPYNNINKIGFVGETNFPQLYKSQEVELVITKNAHYPLRITPKGGANEILDILNKIRKK